MKKSLGVSIGSSGRSSAGDGEEDETSKTAIASYQARDEEIERRKMEVRERLESQITRAEEEAKRLTQVWAELEELTDPMRKEVSNEKEYKEAMEAFQEKSNERSQLTTSLMELLNESEKFRMRKLEELSKIANLKA
ncbi:hypothetical protein SASPL_122223 [Salvia splendens]|uniref:RAB6-interacting golgin n=1 Tax=Salvia splendens TaxID=180675 RepID=A0A8X8XLR3_SALSN|nr:hypothetical protein SASPL_122223 [Salvia splendens]